MKEIENLNVIDKESGKGIDVTAVIENGKVIAKHVDYLTEQDWR